jgi:ABC-type multidrug transport system fused ATPase/permease subunit
MNTYLRVLSWLKPYIPQVVLSMFFTLIFAVLQGVSIVMLAPFLDALFGTGEAVIETVPVATDGFSIQALKDSIMSRAYGFLLEGTKTEALMRIVFVFFLLNLAKNISLYLQLVLTDYVQHSFIRDIRVKVFERLTTLPLSFYHKHKTGEMISRATNDVMVVNRSVNMSFTNLVRDPVQIIMMLGIAVLVSWRLTLIAFVVMPISMTIIYQIGKKIKKYSRRQQVKMAEITSMLQEVLSGIRVVKAFTTERYENRRFSSESQDLFKYLFKISWLSRMSSPLTEQLGTGAGLFILWYGGNQVLTDGGLPASQFMIFLFAIFAVGHPVKQLSQVNNGIQEGMAAAERVFAVIDEPIEIKEKPDAHELKNISGKVEISDLYFEYLPGDPVLRDISLTVNPGEAVALVGSSGGGKSTLVDMVPRFYDPQKGVVKIDGNDIKDLTLESLRSCMGIVTQEVILFNDSVANNIAYGIEDVSLEDIEKAAKAANAHEFISALPDRYDTKIGDRGTKLSGGQRQRLSIARAILKNPSILILDEATSALDTESEKLVQNAIENLVKDRTTIVIAHRLSTIRNADRICVLDKGQIVQAGTHDELLASGGLYKKLHNMQLD